MENVRTDMSPSRPSGTEPPGENRWFVLRDLSRHNARTPGYRLLEREGVRHFTPMHAVIRRRGGRSARVSEPVLRSLLFAYSRKEVLDALTSRYRTLQYRYVYGRPVDAPMVVPRAEMERFIHAVESSLSEPVYYTMEEITPDKYGREVRIIGGGLDGYTGRLLRMRGSRARRLLVELKGLFVAGVEVSAEYIQFV